MIKTISFGIMHISIAFVVIGLMTGDWIISGLAALVEPCVNTVGYYFHERIWARKLRGKSSQNAANEKLAIAV